MRKVILVSAFTLGVIVLVVGSYYVFSRQQDISSPLPVEEWKRQDQEEKIPSLTLKDYSDDSGFAFRYPDDLTVSRKDVTDNTLYAYIQITSEGHPGSILVRVYDDKNPSLDSWIASNKKLADYVASVKDITLADIAARQIKTNDSVVTAALDQGVLFAIEVFPQNEKAYWLAAYNSIVETFAFASAQSSSGSNQGGPTSDDVIFEGEEVVE